MQSRLSTIQSPNRGKQIIIQRCNLGCIIGNRLNSEEVESAMVAIKTASRHQGSLLIMKSGRDSQKKVPARPQFGYGKKRSKGEDTNTESSEKNKSKEKRDKG